MSASTEHNALRDLVGRRVRVYDGQGRSVRAEGEVIGFCPDPMLIVRLADGTLVHESSALPREIVATVEKRQSCSQCGQRTPVCNDCGDTIIFVLKAGFGNQGEWQHLVPRSHLPRPKVFVS